MFADVQTYICITFHFSNIGALTIRGPFFLKWEEMVVEDGTKNPKKVILEENFLHETGSQECLLRFKSQKNSTFKNSMISWQGKMSEAC